MTIVTNMGRFTLKSLPQDISNSASLWNLLTDVDARIDTELNILKNMDDWMLDAWNMVELEQKLEKFLQFADKKTLKLKTKTFVIGSKVEFGGSVLTVEKVKNQELILPRRIKAFEELCRPENKEEPISHPTKCCICAFFIQKPTKEGEELKARLIRYLKKINPDLVRLGNPSDGSSHILRRLEQDDVLFGAIELSSGYHQVSTHLDSN